MQCTQVRAPVKSRHEDLNVTDLCSLVTNDRTQEKSMKLCQGSFKWNNKKRFFPQKVVVL